MRDPVNPRPALAPRAPTSRVSRVAFGWPVRETQDGGLYIEGRTARDSIKLTLHHSGTVARCEGRTGAYSPQREADRATGFRPSYVYTTWGAFAHFFDVACHRSAAVRAFTETPPQTGRFWLHEDRLSGFALDDSSPVARLTCVFSLARGRGPEIARLAREIAVRTGGAVCDGFGEHLARLYLSAGWQPTGVAPWNPSLAPPADDAAEIERLCGPRPDVYFFRAS